MKKSLLICVICISSYANASPFKNQLAKITIQATSGKVGVEQNCAPEWGNFIGVDIHQKENNLRCVYAGSPPGYALSGKFSPLSGQWHDEGDGYFWCDESAAACKFEINK